jgi:hypothetical protein
MAVDDIERAQPKKDTQSSIATKNTMKIEDIEGTKSRPRVFQRPRMTTFSTLEYSDVTKKSNFLNRSTNPLMPTYMIRDEDGKLCEIGPV